MPNKKITLAKYAGFCYGVKRAVEAVKKLKLENPDKNIYVLGELIHNSQVIGELQSSGINTVEEIPQDDNNGICVVRTHGQTPQTFKAIADAGFEVLDLTCPDVKKVQQKAIELIKDGYYLVIVGKEEHPEVAAIKANALQYGDSVLVAENIKQLKSYENVLKANKKIGVVVQTTQMISVLSSVVDYLTSIAKELHIANTICPSTSLRQNEALEMARENDLMIVVGSKNSANTTHLAQITNDITRTIHIETSDELDTYKDVIEKFEKIGVTAGASTPQSVIENVVNYLSEVV